MKSIKKQFIKILNFLSVPLQMFGVMVLYFVIEAISRHSVSEAFSYMTERPLVFLLISYFYNHYVSVSGKKKSIYEGIVNYFLAWTWNY